MKIDWKPKHIIMLSAMQIPFDYADDMTDDQLEQLYEAVPDYLEFDENGVPTEKGGIVEEMITLVSVEMRKRKLLA